MRSKDFWNTVHMKKLVHYILPKHKSCPSRRYLEAISSRVRIWPDQICKRSFVRDFLNSIDLRDLINLLNEWREAAMDAKMFVINHCSKRKVVKEVCNTCPNSRTVEFTLAFSVKTVNLCCLSTFVVSPNHVDLSRVFKFKEKKQANYLHRVRTPINIVS